MAILMMMAPLALPVQPAFALQCAAPSSRGVGADGNLDEVPARQRMERREMRTRIALSTRSTDLGRGHLNLLLSITTHPIAG